LAMDKVFEMGKRNATPPTSERGRKKFVSVLVNFIDPIFGGPREKSGGGGDYETC